ncbi:hypothetical protein AAL_02904 [Moelleriella libera RCEF 2490]|uniref:Integral membrane protein n=1 Tax=Moelleriella libera RCEF 2490 TaxID=1081109 RepID=A0A168E3S1_9HYPO|nr:hypothetical protein AAL_02904 [Moelleriella libera RCEF 2490]
MASPDFRKFLLAAPLLSSTGTILFAWDQHLFFNIFTHPELEKRSNSILPAYWRLLFPRGLAQVVSLLGITTWTSIAAIVWNRPLLAKKGALPWYAATAGLALGHLVYVPLVAPLIKYMVDDEGGRSLERKREEPANGNVDAQKKWLGWHMMRTLTTDLGAWLCCVVAVGKTFSLD